MYDIQSLSTEQMHLVIESANLAIWDWHMESGQLFVNHQLANMLGYSLEEISPIDDEAWKALVHPNDLKAINAAIGAYLNGKTKRYEAEFRIKTKNNKFNWFLAVGRWLETDSDGKPIRMMGVYIDRQYHKLSEQELDTKTRILEESQRIAKVGGWELNLENGKLFWTAETYRIHDTSPEEFDPTVDAGVSYFLPESKARIIAALEAATTTGEGYDLELETYTTKGRKIDVRTNCIVTLKNGKPFKLSGTFQDISEQKAIQRRLERSNGELAQLNEKLKKSAHYDTLTELPNRALLEDRMNQSVARCQRTDMTLGIVFIDLDGFKSINDRHGHGMGDKLLCRMAQKMESCIRRGDTLARFGGDEFVMLLEGLDTDNDSKALLDRLLHTISEKQIIQGKVLQVTASIGVTIFPKDNSNCAELIRNADHAMYVAKNSGKNAVHFFDGYGDDEVRSKSEEVDAIRTALHNQEFVLFYQPKVDLRTNAVIGVEALIRWQHPEEGLLLPYRFLPAIEGHRLSIEVGEWVIAEALAQLKAWQQRDLFIPISINIDSMQLQDEHFVERLAAILERHAEFKPGTLEIEIVETSAVNESENAARVMIDCEKLGVSFSIDDFGTGYSSLIYLKRLPTRCLKIDRSFVRDILVDPEDRAIVQGVIQLASTFKQSVIAEGVETIEHGAELLKMGCYNVQGFGIAKPMPARDIERWFQEWNRDNAWRALAEKQQKPAKSNS